MKIMHLLSSNKLSGAEKVACNIIKMFNKNNSYEIIYVCPKGEIITFLEDSNINYRFLKSFNYIEIKKVINDYNPDIIHAHDFRASILSSFFYKKSSVISHLHHNAPWASKLNLKTILYLTSIHRYKKIIGVSNSVFDKHIFKKSILKKGIIINNPINLDEIYFPETELSSRRYDIIYVGRLSDEKNPMLALKVFFKCISTNSSLKCAFIGDGYLYNEIKKYINHNNLTDNIDLLGFKSNVNEYLANSKIVCIPSKWEGFGLIAIESMCEGCVIVTSGAGELKNIVDSKYGFCCNDIQDYVHTITNLLNNYDLLKQYSKKSKERAVMYDNYDEYRKKLKGIYNE